MKIECNLSSKSFADAAAEIRKYKITLESQCAEFCNLLANTGCSVIKYILSEHVDTGQTIGSVEIVEESEGGNFKATVRVTSDAIMFLEFGSGLTGQGFKHPTGRYGSGTYPPGKRQNPNYDNWENPEGWYYYDGHGHLRRTKGMVASMPMYRGGQEMKRQLETIAKKVFKYG